MPIPLPPAQAIRELLTELIGRDVSVRTAKPGKDDAKKQAIAAFDDAESKLRCVAYCDLPLGGSLGAALVLLPPGRVEDSLAEGGLDKQLTENLYEVFNVLSSVFPQHGSPRLILRAVYYRGELPPDVKAVHERAARMKPSEKSDFEVSVGGYFDGRVTVLAA